MRRSLLFHLSGCCRNVSVDLALPIKGGAVPAQLGYRKPPSQINPAACVPLWRSKPHEDLALFPLLATDSVCTRAAVGAKHSIRVFSVSKPPSGFSDSRRIVGAFAPLKAKPAHVLFNGAKLQLHASIKAVGLHKQQKALDDVKVLFSRVFVPLACCDDRILFVVKPLHKVVAKLGSLVHKLNGRHL